MKTCKAILLSALCAAAFFVEASYSAADDDPCTDSGIVARNATMLDLWYKKHDGACSIWIHEHLFTIKPNETVHIYSDMNCQTLYCPNNPTCKDYKSLDANGDCGVRILPDCNLSDM